MRLAFALVLTGCGGSDLPPPPRQAVISHFDASHSDSGHSDPGHSDSGSAGTIETVVVDPLPVKAAHLALPDGRMIAPVGIDRDREMYSDDTGSAPNFGVGVSGGSSSRVSTGFGIGFPLFGGGDGGGHHTASMTTSTLRFRIPDMNAYRADWQHWILHLDLDDGANRRSIETLPPAPPPP
jgi:hypothetical protein